MRKDVGSARQSQQLKWPPPLTLEHLWIALPVVITVAMGFRHKLRLLDFWWHLKIGEIIVETSSIPRTDMFSFTVEGAPFILQNWLTEALYFLIYRIGGLELLIAANTVILVAALLPIYHLCWDSLRHVRLTILTSGLAVFALAAVYSNVRPQTVSFLFFAVFYWVLLRFTRNQQCFLWILPLLMVLWVNLHGAFVLGLGLILLFFSSETVRRLTLGAQSGTLPGKRLNFLMLVLLLTCLATLVNPETYRVYDYVLTVLRDPGSQVYVSEWQSPNIREFSGVACFYGPFLLSLLVLLYSRKKLNLTELLLYVGFAYFAVTSLRNGIWFALVMPPIVARLIGDLCPSEKIRSSHIYQLWASSRSTRVSPRKPANALNFTVALIILAACIVSTPWLQPTISGKPLWQEETPVALMDFLEQNQLNGNIFHPQAYGDYLIWRLWPQQKSFLDGRVHIFGGKIVEDYRGVFNDNCWEQRLADYDIRYLILKSSGESFERRRKAAIASPNWELLYEDDLSVLLSRTSPQ